MITPEHLTHFWGPVGSHPIETHSTSLVGFEHMVNDSDGAEFAMHAVFVEIDPPNKLLDEPTSRGMTLGTSRSRAADRIHPQTNVPEMYRTPEAQAGMQSSFDRFAAYVSSI